MRVLITITTVLASCSVAIAQQPVFSRLTPSSCPNGSCSTATATVQPAPIMQALAQIPATARQVVQAPVIVLQNAIQPVTQFAQCDQPAQRRRVLFTRLRGVCR